MLPAVEVNYLAVLVCGVAAMVLGFVWYSMPVFGKPWMSLNKLSDKDIGDGPGIGYLLTFLMAIFMGFVLRHFLVYTDSDTIREAAVTSVWISLGFVLPTMGASYVFLKKPLKLFGIDFGYQFFNILIMALILTVWA